jgi:hypothetical protein
MPLVVIPVYELLPEAPEEQRCCWNVRARTNPFPDGSHSTPRGGVATKPQMSKETSPHAGLSGPA